jgi:hypothetical protein
MYHNFKKGDKVNFRKIVKGSGSCEVYHSCGTIEKLDMEGNAYIKEDSKTELHIIPLLNVETSS